MSTVPRRRRWFAEVGWRYLVAAAALAFALYPVVWIVSAAFNPVSTLAGQRLVPAEPTLANFAALFARPFWRWFGNTLLIAGTAAVLNVVLCALGAYAFSRLRFSGRRFGQLTVLLVQMFPQVLAMVALFLLMIRVGDVFPAIGGGTRLGLIFVYLGGALGVNTWLMKGFFDTIPRDLDESAVVDGATHAQIFFRIILPLVRPILAVVGLLAFVFIVNDFVVAQAVLTNNEEAWPLSIGLFRFIDDRYAARWGPFAAGALIGSIPTITLFMFLQRYIVSGLTQGAVKG